MDLEDLRMVAAVEEEGSLTAAAEQLHVAQPALSRRLARVEREIGGRLFDRGRLGARPTAAGSVLASGATEVLDAVARLERRSRDVIAGRAGTVRVGTTPTLGADLLPPVLAAHRRGRPQVDLELVSSGDSDLLAAEVAAGSLDVALAAVPEDVDPDLRVATRGRQVFVLALPAEHDLAALSVVPVRRLVGERMVVLKAGEGLRLLVDTVLGAVGAEADVSIETTDREMLIPMVAAGLGVTLVPETFARQRRTAAVVLRPLRPAVARPVGALVRAGDDSALVNDFLDALDAHWPVGGAGASRG